MGRIQGIDMARGLAVLGMFTAHLGTAGDAYPPRDVWQVADGRSAATFALLAGVSLALLSGGRVPASGSALRRARVRILVRAALIFLLHWPLVWLGTPILVILGSYAVMFAAAVPVLRVGRAWLFTAAGFIALVVAPVVILVSHDVSILASDDVGPSGQVLSTVADLVLTGPYPAIVWFAYVLVGLGIGRLDLSAGRVQGWLLGAGCALMALGYGIAGLASWGTDELAPVTTADLLGTAEPHSDTTFELVGNTGFALALLGLCLLVSRGLGRGPQRLLLRPLAATGALALSTYSLHIVAVALLGTDAVWQPRAALLVTFVLVTLAATTLWWSLIGRGPLEKLLHEVSLRIARAIVPEDSPDPPTPHSVAAAPAPSDDGLRGHGQT